MLQFPIFLEQFIRFDDDELVNQITYPLIMTQVVGLPSLKFLICMKKLAETLEADMFS